MHKSANDALADAWNATFDRQQAEINRLRTEGVSMRAALEGLLRHCDADPDGETEFERAVRAARNAVSGRQK